MGFKDQQNFVLEGEASPQPKKSAIRDGRRHAKRPRVFALIIVAVAALSAVAVAGLAHQPKADHSERESGQLP